MTIDQFLSQFQAAMNPEAIKLLNWAKTKAPKEEVEAFEDWAHEMGKDGAATFAKQQPGDYFPSCKLSWDDLKKL